MKQIFLIFFIFLFFTSSAQDTIFLQPKNEYFSPKDNYRFESRKSKRFPNVYHSTEKIIFSLDSIKVISILPNFKPAMQNGKLVNFMYIVPIHFQIE